jgi:hypothetical protein
MEFDSVPSQAGLTQGLAGFEVRSVREGAAALSLWPPNADRHAALGCLIEALSALPFRADRPAMEASDWRRWLDSEASLAFRSTYPAGVHDAPLAQEVSIDGERFGLLAGDLEFPAVQCRLWEEALVDQDEPCLVAARQCLLGVARLGDRVIAAAGIASMRWPDHRLRGEVEIPDDEALKRLRGALTPEVLADEDWTGLLAEEPGLTSRFRPLASLKEPPCITEPWRLSLSGLVAASALAGRSIDAPALVERLCAAAIKVARRAAEEMAWTIAPTARVDRFVARADLDCQVMVGVWILPPGFEAWAPAIVAPASLAESYEALATAARDAGVRHSVLVLVGDGRPVTLEADHPALRASDVDPWLIGLGEFDALGDALRLDPLGLPVALERTPRPPWQENFDLLDFVGFVRRATATPAQQKEAPEDGTELILMLGRQMTGRHPAPRMDRTGWSEVSRWSGTNDPAIYRDDSDHLALLVRSPARFIWVDCDLAWADRHALEGAIVAMAAFWFARLCEAGWMEATATVAGELVAAFHVEIDRRMGPALVAAPAGGRARLLVGPGFIQSLCRGDNEADRMLVAAVLHLAEAISVEKSGDLLDEVAPAGRGTVLIWPWPELEVNRPALEPPPPLTPRDRHQVRSEVAAMFVEESQILVVSDADALLAILDDLLAALEEGVVIATESVGAGALRDLIALHERALWQSMNEGVGLPAKSAFKAPLDAFGEDEGGMRNLVLRSLVERFSARSATADGRLGLRMGNWLRAAGELQLQLAETREAVLAGAAGARVVVSQQFGIAVLPEGDLPLAGEALREELASEAPELMLREHEGWWRDVGVEEESPPLRDPIELDPLRVRLDEAMLTEWGVGFGEILRLLRGLHDLAERSQNRLAEDGEASLVAKLVDLTSIDRVAVRCALVRLSLGPVDDYEPSSARDHPGRGNRTRSYLRQPLVRVGEDRFAWSALHSLQSGRYLNRLIESGRLADGEQVRKAVSRIAGKIDTEFEDAVADRVADSGFSVQTRVTQFNGVLLQRRPGEAIGDIDVLAWSTDRKQIWLLDAKRLAPGVDPRSMMRERDRVQKAVLHHDERLSWTLGNRESLAAQIGIAPSREWDVQAALVLDRPVTGARLVSSHIKIVTLWALPELLAA